MRWKCVAAAAAVIGLFLFAHRLPPFERDCNPGGVESLVYQQCPPTPLVRSAVKKLTGIDLH